MLLTRRAQQTLTAQKIPHYSVYSLVFMAGDTTAFTFLFFLAEDTQSNADMRAARLRKAEQEREEEAAWFMQQVRVYKRSGADR